MSFEVFEYLKKYICSKYPMYYVKNNEKLFVSFIHKIAKDFLFTERLANICDEEQISVSDALNDGKLDKTIDSLVDQYAQIEMTYVWANFGTLFNYVKDVVIRKASAAGELGLKTIDSICKDIAVSLIQNNELDYSYYMNRAYDDILINHFDSRCEEICEKCYLYVKDIIKKSGINVGVDEKNYLYLIENVTINMLRERDADDILNRVCDEEVLKKFKAKLSGLRKSVKKHITTVLNQIIPLVGIPVDDVVRKITQMAMDTGEIDAQGLLNGKYDDFIENYANKRRLENDPSNAIRYIYNRIKPMNVGVIPKETLMEIAAKICFILHDKHHFAYKDIEQGKHDSIISDVFISERIRYNSIKQKNIDRKIRHNTKKRKLSKTRLALLTLALGVSLSVVAAVGYGTVNLVQDVSEAIQSIGDQRKINEVNRIDDFDYSYIYIKTNDNVKPTALNALEFYSKLVEIGYDGMGYDYLGFYRAYDNVREDKLYIMDYMLSYVEMEAQKNPKYSDFLWNFKGDTCFLDFACDRLYEMGFTEIRDDKYEAALNAYEYAKRNYSNEKPMDKVSDENKKIIQEIMNKYAEYSRRQEAALGQKLMDEPDVSISLISGRKI